jgi:hypothetical protein
MLGRSISKWLNQKGTIEKYIRFFWNRDVMTREQQEHILNSLMAVSLPLPSIGGEWGGGKEVDDMEQFKMCKYESTVDDIQQLLESLGFNFHDDTVISSQNDRNDRITLSRELGSWIEVEIDGTNKRVTSNCEDNNFHYLCVHQVTFDVLQFNRLPNSTCTLHHENWHEMRQECIKYLKQAKFWT